MVCFSQPEQLKKKKLRKVRSNDFPTFNKQSRYIIKEDSKARNKTNNEKVFHGENYKILVNINDDFK